MNSLPSDHAGQGYSHQNGLNASSSSHISPAPASSDSQHAPASNNPRRSQLAQHLLDPSSNSIASPSQGSGRLQEHSVSEISSEDIFFDEVEEGVDSIAEQRAEVKEEGKLEQQDLSQAVHAIAIVGHTEVAAASGAGVDRAQVIAALQQAAARHEFTNIRFVVRAASGAFHDDFKMDAAAKKEDIIKHIQQIREGKAVTKEIKAAEGKIAFKSMGPLNEEMKEYIRGKSWRDNAGNVLEVVFELMTDDEISAFHESANDFLRILAQIQQHQLQMKEDQKADEKHQEATLNELHKDMAVHHTPLHIQPTRHEQRDSSRPLLAIAKLIHHIRELVLKNVVQQQNILRYRLDERHQEARSEKAAELTEQSRKDDITIQQRKDDLTKSDIKKQGASKKTVPLPPRSS